MTKCFVGIFLSVFTVHILIIFGLGMDISSHTYSNEVHSSMKVRVGPLSQARLARPSIRKRALLVPNKSQQLPIENDLLNLPSDVSESAIVGNSGSHGKSDIKLLYQTELRARIESNKSYPTISKRLGQTGLVVVAFTLLADGSIINARIATSSKFERLNESALQAVMKVRRFKPIPLEIGDKQMEISVPIKFSEI